MGVKVTSAGSFKNTDAFLKSMSRFQLLHILDQYGQAGVVALDKATPVDSGVTGDSWTYEVKKTRGVYSITWLNTHMVDGVPLVILLEYGHGTGTGGYVQGKKFINPAIKPVFDKIANDVWKAVTSA